MNGQGRLNSDPDLLVKRSKFRPSLPQHAELSEVSLCIVIQSGHHTGEHPVYRGDRKAGVKRNSGQSSPLPWLLVSNPVQKAKPRKEMPIFPITVLLQETSYSLKAPSTPIPQGLCTCYSLCLKHFPQVLKCAHLSSNITSSVRPSLRVLIPFLLCFLPHCNSHDLVLHLYNSL